MKKSKSAMQPNKVKPRESTKITILVKPLICIALILTNKAKVTIKPSKTIKSKSAMQLKKVKPKDVMSVTI